MYYTVSEISKMINLSPHTLRFYAKEGLLPFVERSKSGIRMFKENDFDTLSMIECLKNSGMSIKEIRTFMIWCTQGDETIDQRLSMFREQQEKVTKQIAQLRETLDLIKYKCWYYETAQEAGTCTVHDSLESVDIPKDIRKFKEKEKQKQKTRKLYCPVQPDA